MLIVCRGQSKKKKMDVIDVVKGFIVDMRATENNQRCLEESEAEGVDVSWLTDGAWLELEKQERSIAMGRGT